MLQYITESNRLLYRLFKADTQGIRHKTKSKGKERFTMLQDNKKLTFDKTHSEMERDTMCYRKCQFP